MINRYFDLMMRVSRFLRILKQLDVTKSHLWSLDGQGSTDMTEDVRRLVRLGELVRIGP